MSKKTSLRDVDASFLFGKGPVGDDKPNLHRNKLIGGLWRLAFVLIFLNIFGIHWNEKANPYFESIFLEVFDKQNSVFFSSLIVGVGHIVLLVMLIKGVYKTCTFTKYLNTFDEGNLAGYEYIREPRRTKKDTSGFGKAYSYRESVMRSQTPECAAKTLINSSKVIGSNESTGKGYDKATGYINSKLRGMSPSSAFKYLSGK
jgi:hypothetical protein